MRRGLLFTVVFVLAIQTCNQGQAAVIFYSGNKLVELMRQSDRYLAHGGDVDYMEVSEYVAYIMGVYDGTNSLYNLPLTATKGQVVEVVSKYLKSHPERWGEAAAVLVGDALREAFPLKRSQ